MDESTRREALGLAALLGAIALVGATPGPAAAQEQPKDQVDEKADRERVLACGMTEAEADCWETVAKAAGKFFELPKLHPMDDHEVAHAIHIIQH